MDTFQQILVLLSFIAAIGFLIKKYLFENKNSSKNCGKGNNSCH